MTRSSSLSQAVEDSAHCSDSPFLLSAFGIATVESLLRKCFAFRASLSFSRTEGWIAGGSNLSGNASSPGSGSGLCSA